MGDIHFNADFAKTIGLEKAIIYEYVVDNLEGKPFKAAQLANVFPFWSKSKIVRFLKEMADEGILAYSDYREYKGQSVNWYEEVKDDEED